MNNPLFDIELPNQEKYPGLRLVGAKNIECTCKDALTYSNCGTLCQRYYYELYENEIQGKLSAITEDQAKDWGFGYYQSKDHYETKPPYCIDEMAAQLAIQAFKESGYEGDLNNILLILIKK